MHQETCRKLAAVRPLILMNQRRLHSQCIKTTHCVVITITISSSSSLQRRHGTAPPPHDRDISSRWFIASYRCSCRRSDVMIMIFASSGNDDGALFETGISVASNPDFTDSHSNPSDAPCCRYYCHILPCRRPMTMMSGVLESP